MCNSLPTCGEYRPTAEFSISFDASESKNLVVLLTNCPELDSVLSECRFTVNDKPTELVLCYLIMGSSNFHLISVCYTCLLVRCVALYYIRCFVCASYTIQDKIITSLNGANLIN